MAYYSGTAANLTALRTALLTHAQADGWTLTGDVLSKAGVYFQIKETANNITCLGCESNAVASPAPGVVSIGRIFERSGYTTREMSFPCTYEVFGFTQEIYLVANYNVDSYQWMAFGKTGVPGVPGQGGWCCATLGPLDSTLATDAITITTDMAGNYFGTSAAMFWGTSGAYPAPRNGWANTWLDGHGWTYKGTINDLAIGINHAKPLIGCQPSAWNSEATLLPIRCIKERPLYKSSLVVDLENARHFRIDNYTAGDILTIGSDKWKLFPWYRKNSTSRNGGTNINHTGTFGWAIRYQGP